MFTSNKVSKFIGISLVKFPFLIFLLTRNGVERYILEVKIFSYFSKDILR